MLEDNFTGLNLSQKSGSTILIDSYFNSTNNLTSPNKFNKVSGAEPIEYNFLNNNGAMASDPACLINNMQDESMKNSDLLFQCSNLLYENQFHLAIDYLNQASPNLMKTNPLIHLAILKLQFFQKINNQNLSSLCFIYEKINNLLNLYEMADYHRQVLAKLYENHEVLQSRWYGLEMQEEYIKAIMSIVNYEQNGINTFFTPTKINISEEINMLHHMEEELLFLEACFLKNNETLEDFDTFMNNCKVSYDSKNEAVNKIIINELLFKKSNSNDTLNDILSNKSSYNLNTNMNNLKLNNNNTPSNTFNTNTNNFNTNNIFSTQSVFGGNQSTNKNTFSTYTKNTTHNPSTSTNTTNTNITNYNNNKIVKENIIKTTINTNTNTNHKKNTKISLLKSYNFKFSKRENIDKKVLRKFRKFLKEKNKSQNCSFNTDFWTRFVHENLFPPVKVENIEFKSFSTQYMIWLFSQHQFPELYEEFINSCFDKVLTLLINTFKLTNSEDIYTLSKYIKNMSKFFVDYIPDNESVVNNINTEVVSTVNFLEGASSYNQMNNLKSNSNNGEEMVSSLLKNNYYTNYSLNKPINTTCNKFACTSSEFPQPSKSNNNGIEDMFSNYMDMEGMDMNMNMEGMNMNMNMDE